jgi:hypothetical protein
LTEHLDELFAELATPTARGCCYTFEHVVRPGERRRYALDLDGQTLFESDAPEGLVGPFVQHVNRRAIEGCDQLVLHAGGVEVEGVGVVFPGRMEAGKSTLAAGLVRAGLAYLTDEAVAIDRETLVIQPYPKPLSLDPGSWSLFPELEPHADLSSDDYKREQWQVAPRRIRPGALGGPCSIGLVMFPRYAAGAETTLEPLRRAEALMALSENTFRFTDHGRADLDLLADVVRGSESHVLTIGDLGRAVELFSSLVGAGASASPVP